MKRNGLAIGLPFIVSVLLAGCAATPKVLDDGPRGTDLSRYKTIAVAIEASDSVRQQTGYEVTSTELLDEFVSNAAYPSGALV